MLAMYAMVVALILLTYKKLPKAKDRIAENPLQITP
jgi:hypothetical protein